MGRGRTIDRASLTPDTPLTTVQLARLLPSHTADHAHRATVIRWLTKGIRVRGKKIRLGGFRRGGVWVTTWGDYLRMRDRYTQTDFDVQEQADSFNRTGHGHRVRRRLERPYGSVRWKADSPDPRIDTVGYFGP